VEETTTDHRGEKLVLNMGPSHPATHGVLRLMLELDGEIITKADPDVGFLHRGDEKIAENMHYNQFVPYTDRWTTWHRWRTTSPTPWPWKN
jgi:NADH-quinone oxidoreductase subunit D